MVKKLKESVEKVSPEVANCSDYNGIGIYDIFRHYDNEGEYIDGRAYLDEAIDAARQFAKEDGGHYVVVEHRLRPVYDIDYSE